MYAVDQVIAGQLRTEDGMDTGGNIARRITYHMQRRLTDAAAVVKNALAVFGLGKDGAIRVVDRTGARQASPGEEMLVETLKRPGFPIENKAANQKNNADQKRADQGIDCQRPFRGNPHANHPSFHRY